ncbi:universal stress protein [Prosthecobacter sp.]|uniref:universal stress protein n=1 Tax=Prosthecobacter sp. TaxID=1965333 RepID=UPI0037844B34
MKTIVTLVDLSELAFEVLQQASRFAKAFNCEVVVLHVVPKEPVVPDMSPLSPVRMRKPSQEALDSHHARLISMTDVLVRSGVHSSVRQMAGATSEEVLAETRSLQPDLIIVGAHPHGTFYHLLIGTLVDDVLKDAPCPVVVVPEHAASQSHLTTQPASP